MDSDKEKPIITKLSGEMIHDRKERGEMENRCAGIPKDIDLRYFAERLKQ